MKRAKIITDGSCLGNPGPGGWAAIVRDRKDGKDRQQELSGSEKWTTNNRMEMTAVIQGLKRLSGPHRVNVELDSEYVRNGVTTWIHGWISQGWRKASGDPVKNADLWQELLSAAATHEVTWTWVKGHADHADNNRCDRLARAAAKQAKHAAPDAIDAGKQVRIIAGGTCASSPGPGGWAAILQYGADEKELCGSERRTTSNRLHLTAVIAGLKALRKPCNVTVELDSDYVRNGATSWIHGWERRGWKTASGDSVKNADLWRELQSAVARHRVTWDGANKGPDRTDTKRCDRLARVAVNEAAGAGDRRAKSTG